ncbi:MAG: OmpH family outer membrane protein [SAR86 cluster bacterium]|uniref:OmpH family outer membrane protein n=1 Tax=SAR86 cluster bacterium TaxID=2030880 RepID=A0A368BKS4_9GAMM|nr:MAG: hypothetical protein CBD79_00445 [Gammaproteobacteria bacterium TMED219]RCL37910.1 MAG: OmpH family outer membrane protein [SAR86 cluster bacterium]|tara:strand:+ start:16138 stop:16662 length:525 start_codon:yes stop_codon:yes gene_type:complete
MNIIKKTLLLGLIAVFSAAVFAEGTYVLNAERAMLSTQYAKDTFKKLEEDADFIADRERLELLQAEGQELVESFQQDQETMSDEQIVAMQKKVQDKQNEIQFLANKLQTKAQEAQQSVINDLSTDFQRILGELINAKSMDMVLSPQALFYADPDLDITDEVTALLDVALAEKSD